MLFSIGIFSDSSSRLTCLEYSTSRDLIGKGPQMDSWSDFYRDDEEKHTLPEFTGPLDFLESIRNAGEIKELSSFSSPPGRQTTNWTRRWNVLPYGMVIPSDVPHC